MRSVHRTPARSGRAGPVLGIGEPVFSTFERSGAADVNGINAAAGLYIVRELE